MPETGTSRFVAVLEREIELRREAGKGTSAQALAKAMGIDVSTLSRLRTGTRVLTARQARKIAEHLRPGHRDEIDLLTAELLSGKVDGSRRLAIERWFRRQGKEGHLMVVEFREDPITLELREFVGHIADAIVRGHTYAMVYPFQHDENDHKDLAVPLRTWVRGLWEKLCKTYWLIHDQVIARAFEKHRQLGNGSLEQALSAAIGRLRLYHLRGVKNGEVPVTGRAPAVGHRYFYVEELDAPQSAEIWEWLSPDGTQSMQKKDASRELIDATSVRFFPIVEHFRQLGRLPIDDREMAEFFAAESGYRKRLEISDKEPAWQVYQTETIEQMVATVLRKNGRAAKPGTGG